MKRVLSTTLLLGFALAACGGKTGTIALTLLTSPTDDPFATAAQVRITVAGGNSVQTFPVTSGMFNIKLAQKPNMQMQPILVEALDATGVVLGWGQTSPLPLVAQDEAYSVFVGRPGRFAAAPAPLPTARAEMAVATLPLLGMLVAGGRDAQGNVLKDTAVYDSRNHQVYVTATMNQARAGASGAFVSGLRAAVFGGATSNGLHTFGMPVASLELFDLTEASGLWANLPADVVDARSLADATPIGSGGTLLTGGADGNGLPLATAALIVGDASPRLATMGPMVAARLGHAVAAVTFPDGAGAILFGGLAPGSTAPNAERLLGQNFLAYPLPNVTSRAGATATVLANGNVLIAGGRDASGVLASGFVIQPAVPPTIMVTPTLMSSPRVGHTATLVGADVLLCGGTDAQGAAVASCDLVDGTTLGIKQTIPLAVARSGHVAAVLATGNVLLAGGLGPDHLPTASIEIYTPNR